MSELDNGADIGTGLTISRANLKTLTALPPVDRARVLDALISWTVFGEDGEPMANPCQRMLLDDMKAEHREHVEKHRAFKARQRENGSRPKTKPRLCHGYATAKPDEATAKPRASQKKPNISISNSISIRESDTLTRTRAREESEGGEETYPTEERVLEVARKYQMGEQFVLSWWRRMQASGWRDGRGQQIPIRGWRAKLAYAWSDEQTRRKEGGGRRKGEPSNIHHDPTVEVDNAF